MSEKLGGGVGAGVSLPGVGVGTGVSPPVDGIPDELLASVPGAAGRIAMTSGGNGVSVTGETFDGTSITGCST